jgi:hypothetical protein
MVNRIVMITWVLVVALAACEVGDEPVVDDGVDGVPEEDDEWLAEYSLSDSYRVGCYTDSSRRALPDLLGRSMYPDLCREIAYYSGGYRYVGLQAGGECWAGNTLGHVRVSDAECSMLCTACPTCGRCGGAWRNSVYTVTAPQAPCPVFDRTRPQAAFCSALCPCSSGQGDCDSNAECQSGLVCGTDNGSSFGLPADYDVCLSSTLRTSCTDGSFFSGKGWYSEGECERKTGRQCHVLSGSICWGP